MNTNEILNLTSTKTEKIKRLLELGLTRKEVAELMGIGYGFVQNVYAKHFGTGNRRARRQAERFARKFGIEIEAYLPSNSNFSRAGLAQKLREAGLNVQSESYNHTTRNYWKIVTDSSINSGGLGFELISPPMTGENGLEQLEKACRVLNQVGAKVNKSCGIHIHFDAQNFNLEQWKNLFFNYAKYETAIDSFMPVSRRRNNNTYCESVKKQTLLNEIENSSTVNQLTECMHSRYHKINTKSYSRYKTIEFRQHSGTVEFTKLKNWVYFLHHLVEFSKTSRTANQNLEAMNEFLPTEVHQFYKQRKETLNP